jgi:energy-coupling factor transporter transmembrane protein EcfT
MGTWIFGVVMALFSLFGLFIASRAHDQMLSTVGFLFMAFGLAFIFWLIARNTGHPTQGQQKH